VKAARLEHSRSVQLVFWVLASANGSCRRPRLLYSHTELQHVALFRDPFAVRAML
jgi:hypothetical protein